MPILQSRRRFMTNAALAGAAGFGGLGAAGIGASRKSIAAEPPPETTTLRFQNIAPLVCVAPQYVAEELLRSEGFTDIQYVELAAGDTDSEGHYTKVGYSKLDFNSDFAPDVIAFRDAGEPVTPLAGMHIGCIELFANESLKKISDLKGKTVGLRAYGYTSKRLVTIMAAYVGLDPAKDIHWVATGSVAPEDLLAEGKIDAFVASPPQAQEIRARNIGHVIVNTSTDHPWSQYFCCVWWANTEFVQRYPAATKRALRALLKAADLCTSEPRRVARLMVDRGFTDNYDYALQALNELPPYNNWRDYDLDDTLRFYALRMHENSMIKSTPREIVDSIDWRFLGELKRELKA